MNNTPINKSTQRVYTEEKTDRKCPQCGSLMLEKGNKLVCYNEDCGYIMEKKSED